MAETGHSVLVADVLADVLEEVRERVDRREALGEAQIAVLEAALNIVRAGQAGFEGLPLERSELVREALGSVRAATVATGVALTYAHQRARMLA
ncbi:hypothetical protein [Streptomyces sp. SID3212]|uniref:hypothetical protein n=1 Tax=unclassified Streptomyces TaxID=2593676 RepID=UPI00136D476F|nr:hypothetical protein [Streptomyces sp. SID3212]MYV56182.1 hypothetical protein [Streptomyces sp. SID3212]